MRRLSVATAVTLAAIALSSLPARPQDARASVMIFFDFEIPNMTAEAQNVADKAVLDAINSHAREVELVGHADTLERHPMELSLARANQVRTYMIEQGLPVSVKVRGVGTSEPLQPTPPKTREPMNRFVSVIFH